MKSIKQLSSENSKCFKRLASVLAETAVWRSNEGNSVRDWSFPQQSSWRFRFFPIVTLCYRVSTSRLSLQFQGQVIRITFASARLLSSGNILCRNSYGFW